MDTAGEAIASLIAEGLQPEALSKAQRNALLERVLARIAEISPPLTETTRVATMPWQPVCPGVWTKVLQSDAAANMQIALFRVDPGGVVPAHEHHREETCLVLQGEVLLGEHVVRQGDFHLALVGSRHPDLTAPRGALLLVRSEIPGSL